MIDSQKRLTQAQEREDFAGACAICLDVFKRTASYHKRLHKQDADADTIPGDLLFWPAMARRASRALKIYDAHQDKPCSALVLCLERAGLDEYAQAFASGDYADLCF